MALLTLVYLPRESSFRVEELCCGFRKSLMSGFWIQLVAWWTGIWQSTSCRRISPCVALTIKRCNPRNKSLTDAKSVNINLRFIDPNRYKLRRWLITMRMMRTCEDGVCKSASYYDYGIRGTVHIWRQYTLFNLRQSLLRQRLAEPDHCGILQLPWGA